MSELRAPDPTLTAAETDVVIAWSETPHVAHLYGCPDSSPVLQSIPTEAACWFAVPCRECFPDAPPPGRKFAESGPDRWVAVYLENMDPNDGPLTVSDPHRAWQVQP